MLVPGILAFVLLLSVYLVIRQKCRDAAAKKEEVNYLLAMASRESAIVEAQAAVEYNYFPRVYQCAVCFSPTTTRCSQCKSVRYCSSNCQIIHWRGGHRYECWPSTGFGAEKHFEGYVGGTHEEYKSKVSSGESLSKADFEGYVGGTHEEYKSKVSSGGSLSKADYDNFDPHVSTEEMSGGAPSIGSGEPLMDVFPSQAFQSGSAEGRENLPSDKIATDRPRSKVNPKKLEDAILTSPESDKVNRVNHRSKLNKARSNRDHGEDKYETKFSNVNNLMSGDLSSVKVGSRKPDGAASTEKFVSNASKRECFPSLGGLRPVPLPNDGEDNQQISGRQNHRYSSSSAPGDFPSTTGGGHLSSQSVLSAKDNVMPGLPQNASNGFRTSMQKVVQQLKGSKQSKPHPLGGGDGVAGKCNYKMTFPYDLFLKLYAYDGVELSPFGLINCGNSCYANAVLQCLAFTRPLSSYLVQGLHSRACREKDWCFICEFECLILKAREGESPLSPIRILSKIEKIGSHLGHGREEDAHEFLRYAVDTMQSVCLKEAGAMGPLAEMTTLVGLTFGGYLHSKIKCMKCNGKSEQYERIMDLTVEIDGDIESLDDALAQFTATEMLDGEDKYYCSRCKSYVKAKKKLKVLEAPNILTIVLKRFQSGNFGKLNKLVHFPELLDMSPYMSEASDESPTYSLYAVVVHLDVMNAAFSGHYVCYVKNLRGEWFRIDDSSVISVDLERVLLEGAYMLLYARHSPRPPALVRKKVESYDTRCRRSLEAVPSGHNASKTRCNSSNANPCKHSKPGHYPSWMNFGTGKQLSDQDNWRLQLMQRIPPFDSSSESSSLFSCSDASSCSTASTKDSSRSEDLSDYFFGGMGPEWYHHYGTPPDLDASCQNADADTEMAAAVRRLSSYVNGRMQVVDGNGNPAVLYTDSSKHRRHSSCRETELERVSWTNTNGVRSGISLRRSSGDRSAQTFY